MQLTHAHLVEHAAYVRDQPRLEAYARALGEVVRPGAHVLDLGAGTGVLGLLALRAGAGHVTVLDDGPMLEVARALHRAQGTLARATFVRGHSTRVALERRADVIVCDQVGYFGYGAGLLESYADAAERHLAPGGQLVPSRLDLHLAPAQVDAFHDELEDWCRRPLGFDMSPVRSLLVAAENPGLAPEKVRLLGPGAGVLTLDLASAGRSTHQGAALLEVHAAGRLDGLAGWFRAHLSPGVSMTSDPRAPDAIDRPLGWLPLDPAPDVVPGQRLEVELRLDARSGLRTWAARRSGSDGFERRQSTVASLMLAPADLHPPDAREMARRLVRYLAEARHAPETIARALLAVHPGLGWSPAEALDFTLRSLPPEHRSTAPAP